MAGELGYAGLCVTIVALISVIISLALDYWIFASVGDLKYYTGLWKECAEGPGFKECIKITAGTSTVLIALNAVRAMVLLALVLNFGAIVCGALKLFMMKEKKALGYATVGLLVTAGVCLFVGFVVFIEKIFNPGKDLYEIQNPGWDLNLHAGFAFCIIAWLASLAGAVLFGLATIQDKD